MSGDLEDFLRRAAERRRSKSTQQGQQGQQRQQGQQGQPTQQRRRAPEYSDRHRERVAQQADVPELVDEPMMAELAEEVPEPWHRQPEPYNIDQPGGESAQPKESGRSEGDDIAAALDRSSGRSAGASARIHWSNDPARDLIQMLQEPQGVARAILLKEILERPTHRW